MALVNPYCTLQEVRDQLSDKDSRVADDLLERAVSACSRAVDAWCGRRFWQDDDVAVRTYRPADRYEIEVDDISTTTGLVVQTDPGPDGSWAQSWTLDEDFELGPDNADTGGAAYAWWQLRAIGGMRWPQARRRSLQVTARFGWTAVPDQVREATVLKSVALFRRKDAPFGVAGFGDLGVVRITRADPDVLDLLRPFQRVMA